MSNRTFGILLAIVIAAMGLLLVMNYAGITQGAPEKFISRGDIRGMAVEHDGKLYTLNFDQQTRAAELLNQAAKIGLEGYLVGGDEGFGYQKLIIYRFNQPNIVITPVGFANKQLIFKAPSWNPKGLLRETGPGELNALLSSTYDTQ